MMQWFDPECCFWNIIWPKKETSWKNVATSAAKHSKTHKFRYPQTSPDIPRPTNPWIKTHQMAWPMETPRCAACKVSSANRTSRPFRVVTWSHCRYLTVYTDNTLSSISPLCFLLWTSKVTSQAFPNQTCLVVCQYPEQFQVWWDKGKFIYCNPKTIRVLDIQLPGLCSIIIRRPRLRKGERARE